MYLKTVEWEVLRNEKGKERNKELGTFDGQARVVDVLVHNELENERGFADTCATKFRIDRQRKREEY